jgi:transposase
MKEYIAFDVHKHSTFIEREDAATGRTTHCRLKHSRGAIRNYLVSNPPAKGTAVAVEATGNWYWVVDEIEEAGCLPVLVHPQWAKALVRYTAKTDMRDVHGMNYLQRNKTLPTVWIAPAKVRDLRELARGRMFLTHQRTQLKNRIQATLARYGLQNMSFSDPFGKKARLEMQGLVEELPLHTRTVTKVLLCQLDEICSRIRELEKSMDQVIKQSPAMRRLMTLPGIGHILSVVIVLEIGDVTRFATASKLASYSGCTPKVRASGDKVRIGKLRPDVNRYLKWAFIEAANCVKLQLKVKPERHVSKLYTRIAERKGHAKAIGAVARHLAEAAWHVLSREKDYIEPALS